MAKEREMEREKSVSKILVFFFLRRLSLGLQRGHRFDAGLSVARKVLCCHFLQLKSYLGCLKGRDMEK